MKTTFKIGERVINRHTGEILTIRKIVKASTECYYFNELDGYYWDIDIMKIH
jgi:hypothetical protein